jgi:hypothetical protein
MYHIATEEGYYSLQDLSPNGCHFTSNEVYFLQIGNKVPASVLRFSLSPNPADHSVVLEMELKNIEKVSISLADVSQRQVYTQSQSGIKIVLPIELSNLPSGAYFLTVKLEQGSFVRKVVKK